jgi:BirA family transcriptional regulator, biotin operon repressor / biotin---[acetyl-CoA-carboxylase] ligase
LLKTKLQNLHISLLPLLAAMSLHKVLFDYNANVLIKWPNDILIKDRKIAGILVESLIENNRVLAVIVGFGVNVNNQFFDDDINHIATSLSLAINHFIDKEKLYQSLINQFQEDYEKFITNPQTVIEYCNKFSALNDKIITFVHHDKVIQAKALSINEKGHLTVQTKTQQITLTSGEVSIKNALNT